jgi:hypothetical protein
MEAGAEFLGVTYGFGFTEGQAHLFVTAPNTQTIRLWLMDAVHA